jgi:HPt (histidine-containing phosphotransfer) domain-containing protein
MLLLMGTGGADARRPRSAVVTALIPKFLANRRRDAAAARACLGRGDFDTIARIGHNMRGNGPSYGFAEIADLGEHMEAAAERRDTQRVLEQIDSLDAWLRRQANSGAS